MSDLKRPLVRFLPFSRGFRFALVAGLGGFFAINVAAYRAYPEIHISQSRLETMVPNILYPHVLKFAIKLGVTRPSAATRILEDLRIIDAAIDADQAEAAKGAVPSEPRF